MLRTATSRGKATSLPAPKTTQPTVSKRIYPDRFCRAYYVALCVVLKGARRHRTLYADSPPPSLEIGPKVPHHGRQRRPKEILLDLVEGEKLGFCPMCLYSKYSVF